MDDYNDTSRFLIKSVKNMDNDRPALLVLPDSDEMTVVHNGLSEHDMNTVIKALLQSQSKGAALLCLKELLENEFSTIDKDDIYETVEWLIGKLADEIDDLSNKTLSRFLK